MISVTAKAFVQDGQILNFKIPQNISLKTGEYEVVLVINDVSQKESKKRKLSFSEHDYCLENPSSTFRRDEIYGDSGRQEMNFMN